jgi:queuine/archaeosine tRNA-ribosyltransferase
MLSVHNSHMYMQVMRDIRKHLAGGTFREFREMFARTYVPTQKVLEGRRTSTLAASQGAAAA